MLALSAWLCFAASAPIGPEPPPAAIAEEDRAYHRQRTTLGIAGMSTLTGWAAVNIAAGLTGSLTREGQLRYFHQGNAVWNSVNLVLGVVGLVEQLRARRRVVDLATGLRAARRARLAFLVNGSDRFTGYGQALVLQGAFLFGFDFAMAFAHERRLHERP